jgi:hypothetical protein
VALTTDDLKQIEGVMSGVVAGLATREELRAEIGSVRDELKTEIGDVRNELKADIKRVQTMLEEDYVAEVGRVDRIERRLGRTREELSRHIAQGHTGAIQP